MAVRHSLKKACSLSSDRSACESDEEEEDDEEEEEEEEEEPDNIPASDSDKIVSMSISRNVSPFESFCFISLSDSIRLCTLRSILTQSSTWFSSALSYDQPDSAEEAPGWSAMNTAEQACACTQQY